MLPLRLEAAPLQGSRLGSGLGLARLGLAGSAWVWLALLRIWLAFGWLSAGFRLDFGFGLILA